MSERSWEKDAVEAGWKIVKLFELTEQDILQANKELSEKLRENANFLAKSRENAGKFIAL